MGSPDYLGNRRTRINNSKPKIRLLLGLTGAGATMRLCGGRPINSRETRVTKGAGRKYAGFPSTREMGDGGSSKRLRT
jgi:hypothetical protein